MTGYCLRFHDDLPASASAFCANASSAPVVASLSAGAFQNATALSSSACGSYGCEPLAGSIAYGRRRYVTIHQRPRHVAVSSQRVSSQPPTFGG